MVRLHGHRTAMPGLAEFGLEKVADEGFIVAARQAVAGVRLSDDVADYVVDLVRATRENPSLLFGASPRSANMLAVSARALAVLRGRDFVIPDDVKALAGPLLHHRVVPSPDAQIEGLTAVEIIRQVVEAVPAPR
jgi:MoxR-like ATPase